MRTILCIWENSIDLSPLSFLSPRPYSPTTSATLPLLILALMLPIIMLTCWTISHQSTYHKIVTLSGNLLCMIEMLQTIFFIPSKSLLSLKKIWHCLSLSDKHHKIAPKGKKPEYRKEINYHVVDIVYVISSLKLNTV